MFLAIMQKNISEFTTIYMNNNVFRDYLQVKMYKLTISISRIFAVCNYFIKK